MRRAIRRQKQLRSGRLTSALPGGDYHGRRRRKIAGAVALEFALILPFLVLLTLGLVDFGHLMYVYSTLNNAAREGARRGAVMATETDAQTAAEDQAEAYLAAVGLAQPNCETWCASVNASVEDGPTSGGGEDGEDGAPAIAAGRQVKVTVSLDGFDNLSGFGYNVIPGGSNPFASLNLTTTSYMRWELQ